MNTPALVALACLLVSSVQAADSCPFIRPPALTTQQVDELVLATYAQALHTAPSRIDTSKTIEALDGTENAIITYSLATLAVGEALGFDAIKRFFDATKLRGGKQPFETLSLANMQSLAHAAYAEGRDTEPPAASAESTYLVHSLIVRAPQPVIGWRLVRCGGEYIAFRKQTPVGTSTAGVRVAALPPYQSEARFVELAKEMLSSSVPRGYAVRPWKPVASVFSQAPCVDSNILAEGEGNMQLFFRSRICYATPGATFGYAIMFAYHGSSTTELPTSDADRFVRSISKQ